MTIEGTAPPDPKPPARIALEGPLFWPVSAVMATAGVLTLALPDPEYLGDGFKTIRGLSFAFSMLASVTGLFCMFVIGIREIGGLRIGKWKISGIAVGLVYIALYLSPWLAFPWP